MGQAVHSSVLHEMHLFEQESNLLWNTHTKQLETDAQRRDRGVVYTPEMLVNGLTGLVFNELSFANLSKPPSVLDPSCGTGNFLLGTYQHLLDNVRPATVGERVELLRDCIFGCDIDSQAIEIAKRRLWHTAFQETDTWISYREFPHSNFVTGDALSLVPADDSRHLLPGVGWKLWLTGAFPSAFDIIVGNPPYGKIRLTDAQRQYFAASLYGHANTYGLFLHLGVELLKSNGVLGYVIPASMLSGLYFQNLRRYLAEHCRFRAIVQIDKREGVFDSVLQEVMLLVVQRGTTTDPYTVHVGTLADEKREVDLSAYSRLVQVPVDTVLRRSAGYEMIYVPTHRGADAIFEKYDKLGKPLTEPAIGYAAKTGPVVWNRLKPYLRDKPDATTRPLIWANNVNGYCFSATGNRDKRSGYLECNGRTASLLAHGPCLLVQRTTAKEQRRRIVAAFPSEWESAAGSFFVENHLNLIMPVKGATPLTAEVVLALLNSRLFDFIFRTFNGNTQVSATELNVMRFVVPEARVTGKMVELVRELISVRPDSAARASDLAEALDGLVYGLYGLTSDEADLVRNCTRRAIE